MSSMISRQREPQSAAPVLVALSAHWPALAAALLGASILFVAGFAGPEAIHDAAHDSRHSLNFPCH